MLRVTTPVAGAAPGERLDRAGIVASTLCALHCLAAALIAAAAPALRFVERPELEGAFVLTALVVAAGALWRGHRRHRRWAPLVLLGVGGAALVATRLVEWPSESLETAASVAGAATLVAGHLLNIRLLRRCCAC